MYGKVNPSGCAERHGLIQVRLDFCLNKGDARYDDPSKFYVIDETSKAYLAGYKGKLDKDGAPVDPEAYKAWRDGLPRVWLKERCFHHHFIYLDPSSDIEAEIQTAIAHHLPNFYKAWTDEWDKVQGGMRHGWDVATRKRPVRYDVKEPERYAERKALCLSKLPVLAASSFATRVTGEGETFPSTDIDVGAGATDRGGYAYLYTTPISGYYTLVDANNSANATGSLDTVEAWFYGASSGNSVKVGTFSASGNTLTCRDAESIGEVTSGSKQTYSGLDIEVATGDYIGADARTAQQVSLERDTSGYGGVWQNNGQLCDPSDFAEFALLSGQALSLYGTGDNDVDGSVADSAIATDSASCEVGYNFSLSETITFSDAAYLDIKGQSFKVKVQPKDPYVVQVQPATPYEVKLMPVEPYTVVVLEDV